MDAWGGFFLGNAAVSATLAGLVFVGISINLDRILKTPGLADRALEALIPMLVVLLVTTLASAPDQRTWIVGLEFLVFGLPGWAMVTGLLLKYARTYPPDTREGPTYAFHVRVVLGQAATLPFIVAGVAMMVWGDGALYIAAVGMVSTYLLAFVDAWVLSVEIDR